MIWIFAVVWLPAQLLHLQHQVPVAHYLEETRLQRDGQPGGKHSDISMMKLQCQGTNSTKALIFYFIAYKETVAEMVLSDVLKKPADLKRVLEKSIQVTVLSELHKYSSYVSNGCKFL